MSFKIFHQLGHNYKWNLDSIKEDGCGDGLIIGPRYISRSNVERFEKNLKKTSIFDPQFYLPGTPKAHLSTYEFFPENTTLAGFDTDDFSETSAPISAQGCVDFQIKNKFYRIVIPTRYLRGTNPEFINQQQNLFVDPFLKEIRKSKTSIPVLLQLIFNDLMLKHAEYVADILNWVTSLEIDGVYLISKTSSTSKQIKDSEFLLSIFDLIDSLKDNDLEIVLGYLNTESILLSLANPDIVTVGSYENMRSFRTRPFESLEDSSQIGPNPRLYMSQLMQWIEYQYIGAIKRKYSNIEDIFDTNKYQAHMFEKAFRWHFTKPELYKHHFLMITKQLKELSKVSGKERYDAVREMISRAISKYNELSKKGISFDTNSDGSHLHIWLTVANLYADEKGWR
ncbi:MAG TPA: hypothetical protein VMW09_03520 [Desulfatiglandales bacterium]|nr:hypothetical protein [Desulfatiglandales bacterium]